MDVHAVAHDLAEEQQALDDVVAELSDAQWRLPTPSPRWTITDQIAHLAYFDHAAATAITHEEAFHAVVTELMSVAPGGDEAIDKLTMGAYRVLPPSHLLGAWRQNRAALADAAALLDDSTRVPWYGPSMGAKSFLTARLMETWAHGQDVVDALGAARPGTDRLRHIAKLGFITRKWSYENRGLEVPDQPVRVELTASSGGTWSFGPEEAAESVRGPAEDFCLVVVQRRHLDDTALVTTPLGRDWLLKAQAFAGPPTEGPVAGSRV